MSIQETEKTFRLRAEEDSLPFSAENGCTRVCPLKDELRAALDRQKQLEDLFLHAQKMDALGKLVVGVAHDFNNLLQVIGGHTELLLLDMTDDNPAKEDLEEIQKATMRSTELTRQLLAFSHKQAAAPKPQYLNGAVTDLTKLLKRILGDAIILKCEQAPDVPAVTVDSMQLTQILINLAVNARDAMNGKGTLIIETFRVSVPEKGKYPAGDYAVLSVEDTGCGIPQEILPRIFEPFYTTKPVGVGTGMGLSTVMNVVRQLKGFIEVDSVPGKGSMFRIYLPACADGIVEKETREKFSAVRGNGERILVVAGKQQVLSFLQQMLRQSGFQTMGTVEPIDALKMGEGAFLPDLLFTDTVLPGLSGFELCRALHKKNPAMKVIFLSGDVPQRDEMDMFPGCRFLRKPCMINEILRSVTEVLSSVPQENGIEKGLAECNNMTFVKKEHACESEEGGV